MQKGYDHIDKVLPYGELLRGFANQSCISKGELKKALRERGIFLHNSDREMTVPYISSLLLSPKEFDNLREAQNTREDNLKKSSSRIEWVLGKSLSDSIPLPSEMREFVSDEESNFKLLKEPAIRLVDNSPNKMILDFEIERYDLNKSWYESKNTFTGSLLIEKVEETQIQITKSYTSVETEEIATKFQNAIIEHYQRNDCVPKEKKLNQILFGNFSNEHRIVFFWRLTSHMDNLFFKFKDIEDMEFAPDESMNLPADIKWMHNKKELILKGREIHNTFFIREKKYHPYLKFWGLESKFDFEYFNHKGTLTAVFTFNNFLERGDRAEFQITISNFSVNETGAMSARSRGAIKQALLGELENQKNRVYHAFLDKIGAQGSEPAQESGTQRRNSLL